MVTSGATEALAGALLALIEPGDEVVLFQPMYDAYLPLVRRAGGVPRFVTLQPPHWQFSDEDLARGLLAAHQGSSCSTTRSTRPARCSARTRSRCWRGSASPTTRSRSATRCGSTSSSTAAAIVPLMALPGMRERTVKIGSAGKIFSLTGWKVGFVMAAAAACCACSPRRTSSSPSRRRRTCRRRSPTGSARTTAISPAMRAGLQRIARPSSRPASPRCGFRGAAEPGHLFPQRRPRADRRRRTMSPSARRLVARTASRRSRSRPSMPRTPVRSVVRFCFAKHDATLRCGARAAAMASARGRHSQRAEAMLASPP